MPRSTYKDNVNKPLKDEKELTEEEEKICSCIYDYRVTKNRKIGCKAMTTILYRDYDFDISYYEAYKLTKYMGLTIKRKKGINHNKTKDRLPASENLINGDFKVAVPNTKYCSDTIHFKMLGGELILSTVLDFCGRYIACYHISYYENSKLGNETLRLLDEARPYKENEIIFHTDRGSIYRSHSFHDYAKSLNVVQSMGRAYHSNDNAIIENFHRILREEIWYDKEYTSFEALVEAINDFMFYYNFDRPTTKEGVTPYQMICLAYKENKINYIPNKEIKFSVNLEKQKRTKNYRNPKTHI